MSDAPEANLTQCEFCATRYDADEECPACTEEYRCQAAHWGRYFGGSVRAANDARRDLGLPSSASDSEVLEMARGLK